MIIKRHSGTVIDALSYKSESVLFSQVDWALPSPEQSSNPSQKLSPPSSKIQSLLSGNSSGSSPLPCGSVSTSEGTPESDVKLEAGGPPLEQWEYPSSFRAPCGDGPPPSPCVECPPSVRTRGGKAKALFSPICVSHFKIVVTTAIIYTIDIWRNHVNIIGN